MSETWKSEQAQKVVNSKNIPEWAQGLYYSSGLIKEVNPQTQPDRESNV